MYRFNRDKPDVKSFDNLRLPTTGLEATLDKFGIDDETQRDLSIMHLLIIIMNFDGLRWKPITVWEDPDNPGKLSCIDGQHSILALYAIAKHIFGLKPEQCSVPYILSSAKTKKEAIQVFIAGNTSDSKKLTAGDLWDIVVDAVRQHGENIDEWCAIERKQTILQKYKLFVTDKDSERANENGAITRGGDEVKDASELAIEYFGRYWKKLNPKRATEAKEMILLPFFDLFISQGIKLTIAEIHKLLAGFKKVFDADFSPSGKLWVVSERLYEIDKNKNPNAKISAFQPNEAYGITYLIALSENILEKPMPKYDGKFTILQGDL